MGKSAEFIWNFEKAKFDRLGAINVDDHSYSIMEKIVDSAENNLRSYHYRSLVCAGTVFLLVGLLIALASIFISLYCILVVIILTIFLGPIYTCFSRYNAKISCLNAKSHLNKLKSKYQANEKNMIGYDFTFELDENSRTHLCVIKFVKPDNFDPDSLVNARKMFEERIKADKEDEEKNQLFKFNTVVPNKITRKKMEGNVNFMEIYTQSLVPKEIEVSRLKKSDEEIMEKEGSEIFDSERKLQNLKEN